MSILCSLLICLIFYSSFVDCISHDLDCLIYVFFCKDQWRDHTVYAVADRCDQKSSSEACPFYFKSDRNIVFASTRSPFPLASFTCGSSASFSFMYSPITFAFHLNLCRGFQKWKQEMRHMQVDVHRM